MDSKNWPCPLCYHSQSELLLSGKGRPYYECNNCHLIYVPQNWHLKIEEEKKRYETHQNHILDQGYRNFLGQIIDFLNIESLQDLQVLDYGCGKDQALVKILAERGVKVDAYDPLFRQIKLPALFQYQLIFCTEVAEHFCRPRQEFEFFQQLLSLGGVIGLMTSIVPQDKIFENWYYIKDPTHITFYTEQSLRWIGHHFNWSLDFKWPNLVQFKKR